MHEVELLRNRVAVHWSERGVGDGREGDRPVSGTMGNGSQGFAAADDSGAETPGAVVCHPAPGPGLDGSGHGRGAGKGPTHHRTLGVSLRRGRACGPDVRADRWFPPALDQAQQEELRGAVQQPPNTLGIELANRYWKVVRQFVSERFGVGLSRSSCLNYPRLHGGRLFTGWDLPSSGPRSDWSRLMRPSGRPSWRSTPPCGRRRYILAERYSLLMGTTSGRTRNCGAYGS